MDDLISRKAAIDALSLDKEILSRALDDIDVVGTDREKYSWGLGLIESNINDIEELPSAQPTLYGYQIEHLALIARVMEKEGVTPEKVAELLRDVGKISEMVVDVTQTIREAVRRIDDDPSHPFADGVMMKE